MAWRKSSVRVRSAPRAHAARWTAVGRPAGVPTGPHHPNTPAPRRTRRAERGDTGMPINPDAATEEFGEPVEFSWTSKDALLYAVGVGAGSIDPNAAELEFTTENSEGVRQRVLPTFPVILGAGGGMERVGTYDPTMLV